jgi:diguanylate cyclase (GGDEF)-like protein/putative nucleotidyltransferase with HDIG domain
MAMGGAFLVADLLLVALRAVPTMLFLAILVMFLIQGTMLSPGLRTFPQAEAGWPLAETLVMGIRVVPTTRINATAPGPGEQTHPGLANRERLPFVLWGWQSVLPPLLVLIFSLAILVIWIDGQTLAGRVTIVYVGGFVVLTLMVLRQLLTLRQIRVLRRQLQTRYCALQALNRQLEQQAMTDPLTGLPNHRALVEALDATLRTARDELTACAVIFIDVDHLQASNDRHGHAAGDRVLYRFGELVREILPEGTFVGRWGDGEFVAMLPRSKPAEACALAERICTRVARAEQTHACELQITCSVGVAGYPQDASSREELLVNAARAMYAARRLGCNQVRQAHEPAVLAMNIASVKPEAVEREEMLTVADALLALLEIRDPAQSLHSRRVSALSLKLAVLLGLGSSQTYLVALAGLLHDIGKAALPDRVLWQRDWPDDPAQSDMRQHPVLGARMLAPITTLQAVTTIVRTHHEHLDGSGYPDGLHAEEISLEARIVLVADAYDALTSCSPFHPAHSPAQALSELQKEADQHFDRRVVEALSCLLAASERRSSSEVA